MADSDDANETQSDENSPATPPEIVPSESIFKEAREVWIEHRGERYRLRITRKGKLILQK